MSDQITNSNEDSALAAPPDHENPAIIDAHKIFLLTAIGAVLWVGAIVAFIL